MNLQTTINSEGISIKFFPFHKKPKVFSWGDINRVELLKYSPLFKYGGWGIRGSGWGIRGIGDNKAYNIRGNIGLKLFLKNGNKILIGTQKTDEILNTINTIAILKEINFTNKL